MDPTVTLEALRRYTEELFHLIECEEEKDGLEEKTYQLCMLFDALDSWMTRGGFKPRQWQ